MSKESFKRPTTEVFKKASEKNLLGKRKDYCNPKNLPEIIKAEETLKTEKVEIKYAPEQYLVNNLWVLLGKTSLDSRARVLAYHEIRSAWDTAIDDVYYGDGNDPYGFKEKKVYNLYWLSSRFNITGKCKKLQLADGEIRFLDRDGKVILSFSLDLKSSTRRIVESEEMLDACKGARKEKAGKTAEQIVEPVESDGVKKSTDASGAKKLEGVAGKAVAGSEKSFLSEAWKLSRSAIEQAMVQKPARSAEVGEPSRGRRSKEEAKPVEVAKPIEFPAPKGTARPAETAGSAPFGRRSAEAAKPAEVAKRKKAKKEVVRPVVPVQVAKPIEAAKPVGAVKPVEAAKPVEAVKPVEIVKPEAPKSVETPKKVEPVKAAEVPEPVKPEEKVKAMGNVYKELPPEILPLLNSNGHFSIVVLGGREEGEGPGHGLFDTMKQVVFDPASNKLLVVSYSRDAFLPPGHKFCKDRESCKLNRILKNKPDKAQKVLGELSGEAAPFYVAIGLKEAKEIINVIINDITGPIEVNLPENYVVSWEPGKAFYFPKKTVIKDGNTMLALLQFRKGWTVPDDYVHGSGVFDKSKMKGFPTVRADDSYAEANSRMARQDLGLTAVINALKEKVSKEGKANFAWNHKLALGKLYGVISDSTNLPFSEIQGLMALADIFGGQGSTKESLYFHYGQSEGASAKIEKLKKQVRSKFPTNIAFYEQRGKKLRE